MLAFSDNKISEQVINALLLRDKVTYIEGKYTSQQISDTIKGLGYVLIDTFIMSPIITSDVIDIKLKDKKHKSDLEIQLLYPYFEKDKSYTFDQRLEIIQKHPYSIYLFNTLPSFWKTFDKREFNLLFNSFSSEIRNSQEGQKIFDFINMEITPISIDTLNLANSRNNNLEPIIKDRSKYTLIIFSASWCGPCHEQIPLLKKVFNHCGNQLDMVYISSDRKEEEASWNQMIEKDEIPWRSLFARDYRNGLYKQYQIEGIPHSLLVYPNGKVEKIDVRYPLDKEKLYKLIEEEK